MANPETKNRIAGTVIRLAIAALLWLTLFIQLIFLVPAQRRFFDEHAVPLPLLTKRIINVSTWFADYWWCAIPFALPPFAFIAVATWYFRHREESRWVNALWTLILIGLPFVLNATVWLSLYLARIKVIEGLSR